MILSEKSINTIWQNLENKKVYMGFLDSIQSIISVYLLIAVGYILTKKDILSTEFGARIAWLVVNLTFPAYILSALPYQFTKAQFM